MARVLVVSLLLVICFGALVSVAEVERDPQSRQRELAQCRQDCKTEYEEDIKERIKCQRGCSEQQQRGSRHEEEEQQQQQQRQRQHHSGQQTRSPYVFHEHHFVEKFRQEHGRISVLNKFTDESDLLKGIENYRVAFLVAEPRTFIVPHHLDAQAVFYVVEGTGTIAQIKENERESFRIRAGDVIKLEAGTPVYLINQDDQKQLFIAKVLTPVANPGEFEAFYGGGGDNPDSFYSAFSMELLEAALQTSRGQLAKLFGQQKQGVIIKASKEQIQSLSKEHEEGAVWPFRGSGETKERRPFNIFEQESSSTNEFGRLNEAFPEKFKQLRDVNMGVSFTNITQGAMMGPFYNSKATKIVFVTDGEGYFEMACPHLAKSKEYQHQQIKGGRQSTRYQKVSSRLQRNTVFIVPAGHPVAIVASDNQNLQLVCFEVNALSNERYLLAGKKNIINKMQREAKELAFSMPESEIDKIFKNNNREELFFPGPGQQRKSNWSII